MASVSFVNDLTEIITQAAEAAAGIAGILASFKLIELGEDYYDLYKDQREFYYNTYQQGVEAPVALEVYQDPKPVLNYAGRVATMYAADTGPFGGQSGDALGWWTRHREAYGTAEDPSLRKELDGDVARVKSDWANYLFRFEEYYYDLRQDIRWRKRMMLHNVGIKQGSTVTSSLGRSLEAYQNNITGFQDQMATYGNGLARYAGYKKGLADMADNFNRMGYEDRDIPGQPKNYGAFTPNFQNFQENAPKSDFVPTSMRIGTGPQ